MRDIGLAMQKASLCQLGGTAPNPVLSTLRYFENEYREHIVEKKCRAGKCKDLLQFRIVDGKCVGCTMCARKCPANAITGEKKKTHVIDQTKCIKCGACFEACKFRRYHEGLRRSYMSLISIKINGQPFDVEAGISILDAAKKAQVKIPTLCYHPDLEPWAACGLCIVKMEGSPKMFRACATPVEPNRNYITHDMEIVKVRKTVLELILSRHPNDCLKCGRNGNCELQRLASEFGIREVPYEQRSP